MGQMSIQRQATLELELERLCVARQRIPGDTARAQQRREQLRAQLEDSRRAHAATREELDRHLLNAKLPELELMARLTMHRTLSAWVQFASRDILALAGEERQMLVVLAELAAASGVVQAEEQGFRPERHALCARIRGYQAAYRLLTEGVPAAKVGAFLLQLQRDPNTPPPLAAPTQRPRRFLPSDLGYSTEAEAHALLREASRALNACVS